MDGMEEVIKEPRAEVPTNGTEDGTKEAWRKKESLVKEGGEGS